MQGRHESDKVPRSVLARDFHTDQICSSVSDIDPLRLHNHVLDRPSANGNCATFVIVAKAVKLSVFDLFLRAEILSAYLDRHLAGALRPRNMIEDILPIRPFKVKILHPENPFS
jgi:hypothetical protein